MCVEQSWVLLKSHLWSKSSVSLTKLDKFQIVSKWTAYNWVLEFIAWVDILKDKPGAHKQMHQSSDRESIWYFPERHVIFQATQTIAISLKSPLVHSIDDSKTLHLFDKAEWIAAPSHTNAHDTTWVMISFTFKSIQVFSVQCVSVFFRLIAKSYVKIVSRNASIHYTFRAQTLRGLRLRNYELLIVLNTLVLWNQLHEELRGLLTQDLSRRKSAHLVEN